MVFLYLAALEHYAKANGFSLRDYLIEQRHPERVLHEFDFVKSGTIDQVFAIFKQLVVEVLR